MLHVWVKHICTFFTDWLPEDLFSSSSSIPIRINKHTHQNSRHTHACFTTQAAEQLALSLQLLSLSTQSLPIIQPTPAILAANRSNWGNEMLGQVDRAKTNTAEDGCSCDLLNISSRVGLPAALEAETYSWILNLCLQKATGVDDGGIHSCTNDPHNAVTHCCLFITVLMRHNIYRIRHQNTHSHEEYSDYQDRRGFEGSSADQI